MTDPDADQRERAEEGANLRRRAGGNDPDPLALGVRWLATVPETLAFCALLFAVYAVELFVLSTVSIRAFSYWFVATTTPSPGWLLSALSHAPNDPIHLVSSVALILLFGGMTERRLGGRRYLTVVAVAGLGGTFGQVLWYALAASEAGGTLGASAIALAVTSFATLDAARARFATGRWTDDPTWVLVVLGTVIVGQRLVLDLVLQVSDVGRFGHLWGIAFGVGLALVVRDPGGDAVE